MGCGQSRQNKSDPGDQHVTGGGVCVGRATAVSAVKPTKSVHEVPSRRAVSGVCDVGDPVTRSKSTMQLFMTNKERSAILNSSANVSPTTRLLLSPPFSNFSAFDDHLFLTALGGITLDNLKCHRIKCLVNVADEIPALDFGGCTSKPSLLYYKYATKDYYDFPMTNYFERATAQINSVIRQNDGNVVVFCVAGMSRASTIVLAYAIKHLKMTLKEAFIKLQSVRTYARPSLAFFVQLIQFEVDCLGSASVQMVRESMAFEMDTKRSDSEKAVKHNKRRPTAGDQFLLVPDFYREEYPHLLKMEIADAKCKGSNPFVSGGNNNNNTKPRPVSTTRSVASQVRPVVSSGAALAHAPSRPKLARNTAAKVGDGRGGTGTVPQQSYHNNELKPFVVESISYEGFIAELSAVRANLQMTTAATNARKGSLSSASAANTLKAKLA